MLVRESLLQFLICTQSCCALIIHYSPNPNDCAIFRKDQIYPCNSGGLSVLEIAMVCTYRGISGQHPDSTTDVTSTLLFGTPTVRQRHAFTRVLQGHIAIDTAISSNWTTVCSLFLTE
jgi:Xaa-Pro aminopeptidase